MKYIFESLACYKVFTKTQFDQAISRERVKWKCRLHSNHPHIDEFGIAYFLEDSYQSLSTLL